MAFRNLTNSGKEYLATRLANELPVKFIKAKIGNGSVPLLTNPANTTDLYNFKKQVTILNAVQEQNSIKLTLQITNDGINEGFYLKEIGIYVDDNGKEVLYWYCNEDNSQYINAQSDIPIVFEIDIMMEVTNINSTIVEWTGKDTWISKTYFDEKVRTFEIPTIAELQSRKNLKVGDIVEVLGYYTAGDGAGHKRIIANEDDGSGVQLNNKLWANIVHNGEVNIKWLGAKGDGINDDTNAFNTQFNLFVPAGTFLINNTIKMQSGNYLRGENMYDSIIKVGSDVDGIWVNTDCTLENLAFNCDLETYNSDVIKIGDETFTKQGKLSTMCGVKINNISSDFKMRNGRGNLFHILSSGFRQDGTKLPVGEGYWGLKINHIRYRGYYNRAFKIESKIWNKTTNQPWLTYSTVSDVKGWKAITAIEGVTTFESGDYQSNNILGKTLTVGITFEDCNFESGDKTKDGVISNGVLLELKKPFYLGDFHLGLPGYHQYKIYYYEKISNYGSLVFYDYVNHSSLTKIFNLVNYQSKVEDFINSKINFILSTNDNYFYKDEMYYFTSIHDIKSKHLVWLVSFNKKDRNNNTISDKRIEFILGYTALRKLRAEPQFAEATFYYGYNKPDIPMTVIIKNSSFIPEFVYEEDDNFVKIGIVHTPEVSDLPIRKSFCLLSDQGGRARLNKAPIDEEIDEIRYKELKKCNITQSGSFEFYGDVKSLNLIDFNIIFLPRTNQLKVFNENNRKFYSLSLIEDGTPAQLNTLYHLEKMKQNGVYNDYISYMDEKIVYDKQQRKIEKQKQFAYEQALKENPNLSYEEFMSVQPMTLNLVEEPQPSEALKKFMEKYL